MTWPARRLSDYTVLYTCIQVSRPHLGGRLQQGHEHGLPRRVARLGQQADDDKERGAVQACARMQVSGFPRFGVQGRRVKCARIQGFGVRAARRRVRRSVSRSADGEKASLVLLRCFVASLSWAVVRAGRANLIKPKHNNSKGGKGEGTTLERGAAQACARIDPVCAWGRG